MTETEINIVDFLQGELPARIPAKKDRLSSEGLFGEVVIRPIALKLNKLSDIEALGKTVNTDDLRPAMCGVYHCAERKARVTTNGHYLIFFPDDSITVSQVIRPSTGTIIDERFPDYSSVIPFHEHYLVVDNPIALLAQLKGLIRASKFLTNPVHARIAFNEGQVLFDASYLFTTLQALMETGARKLRIDLPLGDRVRGVLFRDYYRPERFGLVMPIMGGDCFYTTIIEGSTTPLDRDILLAYYTGEIQKKIKDMPWGLSYHHKKLQEAFQENSQWGIEYEKKMLMDECLVFEEELSELRGKRDALLVAAA